MTKSQCRQKGNSQRVPGFLSNVSSVLVCSQSDLQARVQEECLATLPLTARWIGRIL